MKRLPSNWKTWVTGVLAVLVVFILGRYSAPTGHHHASDEDAAPVAVKSQVWTCSMHPQIRLPNPGKCPICFMDLIPGDTGSGDDGDLPLLEMSEAARTLAAVRTALVERKAMQVPIRLSGKVVYDETQIRAITAWVPGRMDRLFVDFTGIRVRSGDHLASIYSPDLLTAQEELLSALSHVDLEGAGPDESPFLKNSNLRALDSAREKLRLWGLDETQVREIEERGKAEAHIELRAPIGGIVIEKLVKEGMYVETGTKIYSIADMNHLWLLLDAYEADLPWIRFGQDVSFQVDAHPGRIFHGTVAFIDPFVNPMTRTIKVRVNVENEEGQLKPEMFARATVLSPAPGAGQVMDPKLAGKWICPMHPEVVESAEGPCRICGMDLVTPEALGYKLPDAADEEPVVIPASAVLWTGKRSVVYVEVPDADKPLYEGREILLGPRAGDYYIVEEGLRPGERVVVEGNFKIDSALQIQAKPSMMSRPAEEAQTGWLKDTGPALVEAGNLICPVSGQGVDTMGGSIRHEYEGVLYNLCCRGCVKDFDKDPEKYVAIVENEVRVAHPSHEEHLVS